MATATPLADLQSARLSALVMALEANYCRVQLDQPGPGGEQQLLCVRRTRLGKTGQQICVGDRVQVEGIDWPQQRAAIAAVMPRTSLLQRPSVANCTRVVVAVALEQPQLDPLQLTRFLLTAERTGVTVELVLTKADLLAAADAQAWQGRLQAWGYQPLLVSSQRREGVEALRAHLLRQPGIAVLCGPSGVGKSSLLNALRPELQVRVSAVSGRLQRGRHTTRHVELFPLAPGVLLADSPGFNRPDLPEDPAALAALFPEIRQRLALATCRYKNCLHQDDPGCAVGSDWDRHALYRSCLETLLAQARRERQRPAQAAGLKQRGHRQEPLLDQRLRQLSRRRRRQEDGAG
ncbi:MAG: ribosome small subunit-dependent GTPase [Cyanobacteriota bacterium]|jgi:ribosome biogenesis GTPase